MTAILSLDDVACARGGMPVLEHVSFKLAPGGALALRGPNGVGKTTLMRCIAGLQPVLAGRITGGGDAVAYAGHANGLKGALSVGENLDFWAGVYGFGGGIDAALAAYQLEALVARPAAALSAGQARRLGLARLLVTGRRLWVLDEPTVSLDAAAVAGFAAVLQDHLAGGGAALIATHLPLGFPTGTLDLGPFRARLDSAHGAFDEAFG